jgi:hypothetical protein
MASSSSIWKLLSGVAITFLLVAVAPRVAANMGLIPPLADTASLILWVTAAGLIIKTLIGDTVAGEFLFYKFGYDNCVVTLGAVLTAFALQLAAAVDLFPGLSSVPVLESIPDRKIQLLFLLLTALGATLLTARVAAAIRNDNPACGRLLSLLNAVVGVIMLGVYVLVFITRG